MALVSRSGSIDWCCMPRIDADSQFGRLLDWERGGYFAIQPASGFSAHREYMTDSMVLTTTFETPGGEVRVTDLFVMRRGGRDDPLRQLVRVVEGVRGAVEMEVEIQPRFDYGEVLPWLRHVSANSFVAIGGNTGLVITSEAELELHDHELRGRFVVRPEDRCRFTVTYARPWTLDGNALPVPDQVDIDKRVDMTLAWWRHWSSQARLEGPERKSATRSALVLKCLSHAPTGAIAAAATTSLPETMGGSRNWDYRFSWIRDSVFTVDALIEVGFDSEADGFRRFIQRSAAGSAQELQIMYGVNGERRLTELELPRLEGYRRSRPVRIGNAAAKQMQLDAYGELLLLSWAWQERGHTPDDDYWRFLVDLVETAAERWHRPDQGIWEIRGRPRHFVHSKVLCWAALDRGLALAKACLRKAPVQRWRREAKAIRDAVETEGYDARRGCFVQSFGSTQADSSLLLLPRSGFLAWDDPRMVRTTDIVRAELESDGLLLRYRPRKALDGQEGREGVFLPCTFWLAECLARQGRLEEARAVFDRAAATGNDVGLYAEEFDPKRQLMLGNFPQALTHLSHLAAAVALERAHAAVHREGRG